MGILSAMKVLHVVPTYLPAHRYGGPIESVHALNKYLVRAGAEVTVYTTAIDGPHNLNVPLGVPVVHDGVAVYYFKPGHLRSWFYAPAMRRALQNHLREFDIAHITSVFLSASTLGARAAHAAGVPYVISPRGSLMRAPLEKKSAFKKKIYLALLERANLARAAAIHFTTDIERREYEAAGLPLRAGITIPNGLDSDSLPVAPGVDSIEFRTKFGIGPGDKVVLFLGRLSWKKGLDVLIPAFAEVLRKIPEALLVLAGGDDEHYRPTLEKLIERARVRERVRFTGELSRAETAQAYRNAQVFALSSYAENFAITVAEAMYFGVPVLVSEEVGLASLVSAAGAGTVLSRSSGAFAAAMTDLLGDPAQARAMGEKGAAAARKLSYEKVAARFLEAYNQIIRSHRAS